MIEKTRGWVSDKPLLLRGTHQRDIQYLIETGVLPSSKDQNLKNQLYFAPITKDFQNSQYSIPLRGMDGPFTRKHTLDTVRFYAQLSAMEQYLREEGLLYEWFENMVDVPPNKPNFMAWFMEVEHFSKQKARKIVNELASRKGFIIEPNEKIFGFPYAPGDDGSYLAFTCPNGLPSECIDRIVPLGKKEVLFLKSLFRGQ